jgi:asparagine synthase (glutamine-hydrolysing)
MCGILCVLNNTSYYSSKEIINEFQKGKNRGPDNSQFKNVGIEVNFGFHRLAINDLSDNGDQPFYYSDLEHNYILMCNGEIYNHKDLESEFDIKLNSTSDCAVLLELFIKLEEDIIKFNQLLRGEYSILILKQHKKSNIKNYFFDLKPTGGRTRSV